MIGRRLKVARAAAGLSLRDLEARIGGRVTAQAISKYERDESVPGSGVLIALADALHVSVDHLTGDPDVILEAIEGCSVDQVALEFEESRLDPSLLRRCPSKTVLFGCISNNTDEVESPEHVASKLLAAAEHLPADQIQAAPDCGLVPLDIAVSRAKLGAMVEGARLARARLRGCG